MEVPTDDGVVLDHHSSTCVDAFYSDTIATAQIINDQLNLTEDDLSAIQSYASSHPVTDGHKC